MIFKMTGLLMILASNYVIKAQFFCKDRNGKRVDWFIGYKQPKNRSQIYPGSTFHYADKDSTEWGPAEDLKSKKNAVAVTLKQYYERKTKEVFYYFYSDQNPGEEKKSHGNRAHAKGVAVFGGNSGFWLIHSVPKFPPIKHYSYPQNGETYGQSFLCVTLKTTSIEVFAKAMKYIYPAVYYENVPKNFLKLFPFLEDMKSLKIKNMVNTSLIQTFKSIDGTRFYDFAKTKKFDEGIMLSDLYSELVAKQMKVSLFTETWMNGAAKDLDSKCNALYKVMNVVELKVANNKFSNNNDHSKWAIGENKAKPLVCVGDINRQQSQKKRGGGAVCFENTKIWKLYHESILKVENCKV
uniref:Deoxyribonuclease II n=1 Tax=Elaeophora elaphi TaxID=1147741 RepID=A0A158Q7L7_9BILA